MEIKIENYLSEQQMKEISEKLFIEKASAEIDRVIDARHFGGNGYDTIFSLIAETYVNKLAPELEGLVLQKCKEEINRMPKTDSDYDTIFNSLQWKLKKITEEIIEENKQELKDIIKPKLFECTNGVLITSFICELMQKLDLNKIIKETLNNQSQ